MPVPLFLHNWDAPRAGVIAPIAIRFFEASHEVTVPRSGISCLEGTHYVLTNDLVEKIFSIQASDGRGELVRVNRHEGNTLSTAQRISILDVANFKHIEQAIDQQREKEKQRQLE